MPTLPFPVPQAGAVLLRPREVALAALERSGWRPYATPIALDPERRRLLNLDLGEADVAYHEGAELVAVAHVETDRDGLVTLLEITGAVGARPEDVATAVLAEPGEPRVSGGAEAREWVWGPEAGGTSAVAGEPVRLWVCAERAYGDRLWAVLSVVRRASGPP